MKALFFDKKDEKKVQCRLCPHNCLLRLNQLGNCNVRQNIDGELVTLNQGEIAAFNIDPIEKKPLYHFYPGASTLSIACNGCNFKCSNCQNYSISQSNTSNSIEITPERIIKKAIKSGLSHITFTYTEPTVFYEFMLETATLAKENSIKSSIVSNGYINNEPLLQLIPFIDGANIDLKFGSNINYTNIAGGKLNPVLNTIKTLFENNIVTEITTLIIPGVNDSKEEFNLISDYILDISRDLPWHLSAFYPTFKMTDRFNTSPDSIIDLRNKAKLKGHKFVYTGNINHPEGEITYCPNCNEVLIERGRLFLLNSNVKNNSCPKCHTKIYGNFND